MLALIIVLVVVLVIQPFHSLNAYVERIQSLYRMIKEKENPESKEEAHLLVDQTKEHL